MESVKVQKGEKVIEHANKYFCVYSQEADFGAFKKKYYVTQHGTKACLLIVKDGKVLLARQYRFLVDRPVWEIPGGRVEEGEDPVESAVRECEEETGIRGLNAKPLIAYPQGLDCMSANAKLFFATECEQTKTFTPDPKEVDMIQWVSFEECMQWVRRGEIIDHFSIIALLFYQYLKNTGEIRA